MRSRQVRQLCITLIAATVLAAPLRATDGHWHSFYAAGGIRYAAGEFSERTGTGFGGGLGFGVIPRPFSTGDIELVARGQYDFFPGNETESPDYTFLSFGLDWKLNLAPAYTTQYFLLLGGGFSHAGWSSYETQGTTIESTTESGPYLSAGGGMAFPRGILTPYVELRLMNISGKLIGDYQYIRLSAGLKW